MSFLALEQLEKTYAGGARAVKAIDLAIDEGQFIVLLGPSGCGKTTTLRMIAGLELPTGGRIQLAGREVTGLRPSQRDVGFVFQFYALYPHMSVAENIAFPLECARMKSAERRATVARIVERLGLEPLLKHRPRELSGGDQQRVALARALVRKPAVSLMDEPLGTLDADRRMAMCEVLRAEQLEFGVTTVYVTHDQEEAMRLADRVVVMSDGVILQDAAPSFVYDEPASLFVANFVGSPGMNFVPGEVRHEDGMLKFLPSGAHAAIELWRSPPPVPNGPATLGIRPEFATPDPLGTLRGKVVADEYLGASRCLHLATHFGPFVVRTSSEASDRPSAIGEELCVALDPLHARLFDPKSGARLA